MKSVLYLASVFLLLIGFHLPSMSQNRIIDSLKNVLKNQKQDSDIWLTVGGIDRAAMQKLWRKRPKL